MRDRVYRTEAVIIRRSDFSEADRLLTLITPAGKLRVVAKGARKMTSRMAGHIELFTYTTMLLAVGRNLDIVTQSAIIQRFEALRRDEMRIAAAYYVGEIADRLVEEEQESRDIFALLTSTLAALDDTRNIDLVLRFYELRMLHYSGYRPHLHHCAVCQDMLTEDANRFSAAAGGVICPRCADQDRSALPMSLAAFKVLRFLQAQPFEAVERLNISQPVRAEVEQILRAALHRVLERDLKSVTFLEQARS